MKEQLGNNNQDPLRLHKSKTADLDKGNIKER